MHTSYDFAHHSICRNQDLINMNKYMVAQYDAGKKTMPWDTVPNVRSIILRSKEELTTTDYLNINEGLKKLQFTIKHVQMHNDHPQQQPMVAQVAHREARMAVLRDRREGTVPGGRCLDWRTH